MCLCSLSQFVLRTQFSMRQVRRKEEREKERESVLRVGSRGRRRTRWLEWLGASYVLCATISPIHSVAWEGRSWTFFFNRVKVTLMTHAIQRYSLSLFLFLLLSLSLSLSLPLPLFLFSSHFHSHCTRDKIN